MEKNDMEKSLEQLSGLVVLADPGDTAALEEIGLRFKEIAGGVLGPLKPHVEEIARRAYQEIHRVHSQQCVPTSRTLEVLGNAVTGLQEILTEGRDPEEVASRFVTELEPQEEPQGPQGACDVTDNVGGTVPAEGEDWSTILQEDRDLCVEFIAEGRDHLEQIESSVLLLDRNPEDEESLDALFRCFHTIKGFSSYLALDDITLLAHEAENLLDLARTGNK